MSAGAHVLLFSADRARWYSSSRHLQHQTTNASGHVVFTGAPPGSYVAVALPGIPAGDDAWQDPAFLESIMPMSIVTAVGDGQTDTVTLRMVRASP